MIRFAIGFVCALVVASLFIPGFVDATPPQVTGAQIQDDSVTGMDILESSLAPVPSAQTLSGYNVEVTHSVTIDFNPANDWYNGTIVLCPEGKSIISGGAVPDDPVTHHLVQVGSYPNGSPSGWQAAFKDVSPPAEGYTAFFTFVLVCA